MARRVRSKATEDDLRVAWESGEPFKAAAARLGMSPNTLRVKWKAMYGEDAFTERGRRLQAAAASKVARALAKTRVYSDVPVTCSGCGEITTLKANQTAHMDVTTFRCERCSGDRDCPVCGQRVDGARGLASHFRHRREAGDEVHVTFEREQEDSRWESLSEGRDYVVCQECGFRSTNLVTHIRVHKMTAKEYRARHGAGQRLRAKAMQEDINKGVSRSHAEGVHAGTKTLVCPDCDVEWEAPKSLAVTVHDVRCDVCQAFGAFADMAARWEGKSEPEDYVTCRVCGLYQAENLTSHLQSRHPDVVGRYMEMYKGAFLMATSAAQRVATNRLNLTRADLAPFMDTKGRVEVAKVAEHFGCVYWTALSYCKQFNLPTRNRLALQKRVLDLLKDILNEDYVWEWSHSEIVNPRTGYRLYFDGYFPKSNLLVEVHGKQHFVFVPYWHKTEDRFRERRVLDALKLKEALQRGMRVMVVRYDEPVGDPMHFVRRLRTEHGVDRRDYLYEKRPDLVDPAWIPISTAKAMAGVGMWRPEWGDPSKAGARLRVQGEIA